MSGHILSVNLEKKKGGIIKYNKVKREKGRAEEASYKS